MQAPWHRTYKDPITGDTLTFGERCSWLAQGVIRRWAFILIVTAATVVIWSGGNVRADTWWNYVASYLAIFIESLVGLAMFGQTRRDAKILREVRGAVVHLEAIMDHHGIERSSSGAA